MALDDCFKLANTFLQVCVGLLLRLLLRGLGCLLGMHGGGGRPKENARKESEYREMSDSSATLHFSDPKAAPPAHSASRTELRKMAPLDGFAPVPAQGTGTISIVAAIGKA